MLEKEVAFIRGDLLHAFQGDRPRAFIPFTVEILLCLLCLYSLPD